MKCILCSGINCLMYVYTYVCMYVYSGFCFVNGRKGRDDFTCISAKGASVVDYCIVPVEELEYVTNVSVITMSTCEEVLYYQEEGYRIPDHSLLRWDLTVGTCVDVFREEDSDKVSDNKVFTKYFVPHGYIGHDDDHISIQSIMDDLRIVQEDQGKLDDMYNELVSGMKSRLKRVTSSSTKRGQPWFTKDLSVLRKAMHCTEKAWLKCEGEDCIKQHSEYLQVRQAYSRGVKLAKRRFQAQKCSQLESNLGCPKTFRQCIKCMEVRQRKKKGNHLEVLDVDGNVMTSEEAVSVWRDHFSDCWEALGSHSRKITMTAAVLRRIQRQTLAITCGSHYT